MGTIRPLPKTNDRDLEGFLLEVSRNFTNGLTTSVTVGTKILTFTNGILTAVADA